MPSGATVGAAVAVNALGQATVGDDPHFWAAPFEQGDEFGGLGPSRSLYGTPHSKTGSPGNTTIAIVATDLTLTKSQATRMAIAAHDGMARAIVPAHTPLDGDLVFTCSTAKRPTTEDDLLWLGHYAATTLTRAIARGVYHATTEPGEAKPSWQKKFASSR